MREGSPGLVLGAPGALDHVIIHWEFIANCLKQAPAVSTKIRYNSSSRCAGSYLANPMCGFLVEELRQLQGSVAPR